MPSVDLLGYADKLSVLPGETVTFMVSAAAEAYDAEVVRLLGGPSAPEQDGAVGPALFQGRFPGRVQRIPIGSYAIAPDHPAFDFTAGLTIQAWLFPTLPARGREEGIVSRWSAVERQGFAFLLDDAGRLTLQVGDGQNVTRITAPTPLHARRWVFVAATYRDGTGHVLWRELPRGWVAGAAEEVDATGGARLTAVAAPLLIGALALDHDERHKPMPVGSLNGKIERPRLWKRALSTEELAALATDEDRSSLRDGLVADWDFSCEISSATIVDRSPSQAHGQTVNMPTRGVAGRLWDGTEDSFRALPEHYGAIAFHEDDLEDCRWDADFTFTVPADTPTGIYAARLRAGDQREEIPFYVRPATNAAPAPILYLAPTNTYFAYANFGQNIFRAETDPQERERLTGTDRLLLARRDLAGSTYDRHRDGSGVCYSSRLRPVATFRSVAIEFLTRAPRHFSVDLYLVEWLDRLGVPYHVATDEDLHRDGAALLAPYKVVLTGSHPEYWTADMLDALEDYLGAGGRLMYLGGNGFYWVTAMDAARPHVVEVRRGINGTRSWTSEPGEWRMSLTGEIGGLWRYRGRYPNRVAGVGFASEAWDKGSPYHRLPDSHDPRAAFVFAGIGDEPIGGFGLVGNGAAGDEIDRYDLALGTPSEALRLATSEGEHSDEFQLVVEDTEHSRLDHGGTVCPKVRSDLVLIETPNGGAVFSVGSINWIGSMAHHDFANNTARLTENVLRRFAELE